MPSYRVQSPSGQTLTIEGDAPPTEKELDDIFASTAPADTKAPVAAATNQPSETPSSGEIPISIGGEPLFYIPGDRVAHVVDRLKDMGIRAAGPAIGQAAGALGGPFAEVTVPLGGAIGGVISEGIANNREGIPNTAGKYLAAAGTGAVPGASLAKAGVREVGREALKYAATNTAAKYAETITDRGEVPTVGEIVAGDVGALGGAVAGKALSKAGQALSADERLFSDRDAAFKAVRSEGVVVPPHMMDKGSDALASIAGPVSLEREAAKKNLFAWQKIAREDLGLSKEGLPIRVTAKQGADFPQIGKDLKQIRTEAAEPYKAIEQLHDAANEKLADIRRQYSDPQDLAAALNTPEAKVLSVQAGADVNALKTLREQAQDSFEAMKRGDSEAYNEWQANKKAADVMEDRIEEAAKLAGDSELLGRLQGSRRLIAKTYAVENAVNKTTGLLEPHELAAQFNAGVPLDAGLLKIANFENAFDRAAVDASMIRNPNVGKMTALASVGQASRGNPAGFIGGAITAAGKPIRSLLLSDAMQNSMLSKKERQNFAASYARYLAENFPDSRHAEREREEATRAN